MHKRNEITEGKAVAVVSQKKNGEGMQEGNWNCPQTTGSLLIVKARQPVKRKKLKVFKQKT